MENKTYTDKAWWDGSQAQSLKYRGMTRSSRYLTMRDGVRIAIDIHLPKGLKPGEKLPALIHQTRYFRRTQYAWPFGWLMERRDLMLKMFRYLVERGYALVCVDARGSGASFGSRPIEFSPDEVKDGAEVVDWAVSQDWCSGAVGTFGVSYNGVAAERLLSNQHPAVKAAVVLFSPWDIYHDILRPGGVYASWFVKTWSALNRALDSNQLRAFARSEMGWLAGLAVRGVAPVDDDSDGELLRQSVAEHAGNYDIQIRSLEVEFRDDQGSDGLNLDLFSPHAFRDKTAASGAAIYSFSGWYDGALPLAAIQRFQNIHTPGSRLTIGPWDHGGLHVPDPHAPDAQVRFDFFGEMVRFFDHHLKGIKTGIEVEPPVHFYTMGAGKWEAAACWPEPGSEWLSFYCCPAGELQMNQPPACQPAAQACPLDYETGSGLNSRWVSLVNLPMAPIHYPHRAQADEKLLCFTTAPLTDALDVTGAPQACLWICSDQPDAQVFIYLEDVWPDGGVTYVTEGMLRAVHRKSGAQQSSDGPAAFHSYLRQDAWPLVPGEPAELAFHLLPVSYLLKEGHAIRLSIGLADRDNFALYPPTPPRVDVLYGGQMSSQLRLPVRPFKG